VRGGCQVQNPARQRFFLGAATRFLAAFVTFVLAMLAGFFTVGFFVGASFRWIATRFSLMDPQHSPLLAVPYFERLEPYP
jgi:uncharacterized iron-regulated membrane protein